MQYVLLSGASGFVGYNIILALIKHDFCVFALTRSYNAKVILDSQFQNYQNFYSFIVDWQDVSTFAHLVSSSDFIIHCAGLTSAYSSKEFYEGNVLPTNALLELAKRNNSRLRHFIFISSQAAAGPALSIQNPISEEYNNKPISDYGFSKNQAERICTLYKNCFPISILRPSAIYGPADTQFYALFKLTKFRLKLLIAQGRNLLNLIYIKDFVQALILTMNYIPTSIEHFEVFFVTDGYIYSWKDIYDTASKVYKRKTLSINIPTTLFKLVGRVCDLSPKLLLINSKKIQEILAPFWLCSNNKITAFLNFKPKYSIEQGFKETLAWYQVNKWL